jgi:predicted metalloendopeptidase
MFPVRYQQNFYILSELWCNAACTDKYNSNSNGAYYSLSIPVGSLYVRKFFKEDAKTTAMEMVDDIRKEFINILMNVDWMDEKTK